MCGAENAAKISFFYGYVSDYGMGQNNLIFWEVTRPCQFPSTTTTIRPPRPPTFTPATRKPTVNKSVELIPWAETFKFPQPESFLKKNFNAVLVISVGSVFVLFTVLFAVCLRGAG